MVADFESAPPEGCINLLGASAMGNPRQAESNVSASLRTGGLLETRPWSMLILLLLIGILNYVDRVLPAILAEPIKRDIGLSDTALGLINGLGFLIIYGAASIPLARISDRGQYGAVITGSVALWSAMTVIGGWTITGWQLAASRMGVALGEAGGIPAAHAYINRHLPQRHRALGLSIFTLCMPLGSLAGFAIGGMAGEYLGWRTTFVVMGLIGLVLAFASYLALPGGSKANTATQPMDGPHQPLSALFCKRSLNLILLGSAFIAMGGYTSLAFTPSFLMRSHALSLSEAGIGFGVIGGIAAIAMLLLIGWASNRLSQSDARWLLGTVIIMIAVSFPLSVAAYLASSLGWALFGVAVNHGIVVAQNAPVFAALHRLAPVGLIAQASALLMLAGAVLGGVGPLIAGVISDALQATLGPAALSRALLVVPGWYILGAVFYCLALVSFRSDLAEPNL